MENYEKLGAFYLGRVHDLGAGKTTDDLLLYDAKDLTTHAVCVGMTGSGKTGLGVTLLEEAAIDGIPAIAIDPKGDLGNLLLTFPDLAASDFRPWVDEAVAAGKGRTPDEHAAATAELWRKGLAAWDQDGARIARFRDAVDTTIYTPGSSAGRPLAVLKTFAAPAPAIAADGDAMRDRVMSAVSGLLALVGIDADPIRSREHILLSNILDHAWKAGRDLSLAALIQEIQRPPFAQVGVFDLDTFYPASDRLELAMAINNLLASPGFSAWTEGEPLDIGKLLYTAEGKPRLSILSIAHLSEAERMFFVTQLLNEVVSWMRTQSGTSSLRALLYMDEVFGYFPPTREPPSKRPMLTLLKQARAYGLGCVLATQNPVDLDYKGLSNAGTWFLGRLQTERDKARVIEGLEGASAAAGSSFDRGRMEAILAGLGSRVFLMNNVHEDEPVLFHTRWALSYLRGPLTREHIKRLTAQSAAASTAAAGATPAGETSASSTPTAAASAGAGPAAAPSAAPATAPVAAATRPVLSDKITERFLPAQRRPAAGERLVWRPALLGSGTIHHVSARVHLDEWTDVTLLAPLGESGSPWDEASVLPGGAPELHAEPLDDGDYATLPKTATKSTAYTRWGKMLKTHLYREFALTLWKHSKLKLTSKPGESLGDFRVRLGMGLRERRDRDVEKLRKRYQPKLARLRDQIVTAEQRVEREQEQYKEKKTQTAISFGSTLLGALFGRKLGSSTVGRATTTARRAGRAAREKQDVARAREKLVALQGKLKDLQAEFERELEQQDRLPDVEDLELAEVVVRPRKTDLDVGAPTLVWTAWIVDADGIAEPASSI